MPSVTIASRIVIPVGRIRPGGPVATAYDPGGGAGAYWGCPGAWYDGWLGGGCCGWSDGVLRASGMVCAPHPGGGPAGRRRSPRSPPPPSGGWPGGPPAFPAVARLLPRRRPCHPLPAGRRSCSAQPPGQSTSVRPMTTRPLRPLFPGGSYFESPRWHDGSWWVSDFYTHQVTRITPDGEGTVVAEVEQQPSGLGWLPDGSMVVVSMKDQRLLRLADGELSTYADLAPYCGGHLNDCVVDDAGRVFVGDFGFDLMGGADIVPSTLKRVDPDGSITVVAEDLHFPNGSVITPDGTLIVGETWGNRFSAFDIAADGSLSNRRVWAELGPVPEGDSVQELMGQVVVAPDGCTLDAEGHVWVADGFGKRVVRVAPGGGIVGEIAAPGEMGVYAC